MSIATISVRSTLWPFLYWRTQKGVIKWRNLFFCSLALPGSQPVNLWASQPIRLGIREPACATALRLHAAWNVIPILFTLQTNPFRCWRRVTRKCRGSSQLYTVFCILLFTWHLLLFPLLVLLQLAKKDPAIGRSAARPHANLIPWRLNGRKLDRLCSEIVWWSLCVTDGVLGRSRVFPRQYSNRPLPP